jgi:flagellar biosynthesis protein FlhG
MKQLDQVHSLRNAFHGEFWRHWCVALPNWIDLDAAMPLPTIIAVGGGKGGVGKSVISANLAGKIARNAKVLAVDLDLGGANLHTYFGLKTPKLTISDLILGSRVDFQDISIPSGITNLDLVCAGQDYGLDRLNSRVSGLQQVWAGILESKSRFGYDYVVLDLGAGTASHTIDFFLAAHVGIMSVLPDPTSIENAYSFLRALLWRLIQNVGGRIGDEELAKSFAERIFNGEGQGGYAQALSRLKLESPRLVNGILAGLSGRRLGFVANQIRGQTDIEIAQSMASISKDFFGFNTLSLGYLNFDDSAWKALRNRRLLIQDFPHCLLSRRLDEVLVRLQNGIRAY